MTLFAAAVYLAAAVLTSPAAASCGAASCPMDQGAARPLEKGAVTLGYEFEFIPQDKPWVYGSRGSVGQIPGDHDEAYTITRVHRLRGTWDPSDRLSVELSMPFVARSHGHRENEAGMSTDESWSLTGPGDLLVLGRFAFLKSENRDIPTLSLIAGAEFPTGYNEVKNGNGEEAESPVQPGSGSYDVVAGLSALQIMSAPRVLGDEADAPVFLSATYRRNGRGKDRYRIGDTAQVNLGSIYPLTDRLGLQGQVNLRVNRRDEAGDTTQEVQKTGGTYLFLSPGFEAKLSDGLKFAALVQFPVYQWVNQIQLVSPWNLITTLSYRFRL